MILGIIGAMDEEINKLKQVMDIKEFENIAGCDFYIGSIDNKNVVVAKSNEGKVNSSICTQILILNYKVDKIINVGVAGGISDELDVGGVAISKDTVQFDQDTTKLGYEPGYTFGLKKVYIDCENEMIEKISNISNQYFNTVVGTLGSSDKFISDENEREYLKNNFNVISVDMESASINHVCKLNDVPFCAIRAISDNANSVEYNTFLDVATENLYNVVINYIKSI